MSRDPQSQVVTLLTAMRDGSASAETTSTVEELMLLVYPRLRRLAQQYFASERANHTLQPTAVVHEAFCQLVEKDDIDWQGKTHFFAVGARAMRRILVDHARARVRTKRGGDWFRVSLVTDRQTPGYLPGLGNLDVEEILTLNTALERLAELDPRQAKILDLRFFAGMTVKEVAAALGLSKRTVEGDWAHARVWLERELERVGSKR